ncbi:alkaline phosphatase family protein [Chloroflexota bacterium]
MDESHIRQGDKRYRDVIKHFYMKVDSAIGRLIEKMPEGTNILIVSDHGFGPMHGNFIVNRWLENNNFLKLKDKIQHRKANAALLQIRNFVMAHLSPSLTRLVANMLPRIITRQFANMKTERDSLLVLYNSIDWSQTKAYGMGKEGMICINLKGREPWGIVEPGQEYEEVRDEIIAKLRQITNPETGKVADIKVFKKEEVYHGQYFRSAPDIL